MSNGPGPAPSARLLHRRRRHRGGIRADPVEANARITGSTAAVLLVLLAAEGATVPFIGPLLTPHVVIGMILLPPILLKIASTGYRFARYYRGDAAFRRKGPPPALLRILGPLVVVLTLVLMASGIALLFVPDRWRGGLLFVHRASFVLWFAAMTVHVLGHLLDTAKLAPRDWYGRTRRDISGTPPRQWLLVASVVGGVLLGALFVGRADTYRSPDATKHPVVLRHSGVHAAAGESARGFALSDDGTGRPNSPTSPGAR